MVLEFLLVHDQNKTLISTMKHILEVFPEGVVIRDNTTKKLSYSTLFVNQFAQDVFKIDLDNSDDSKDNKIKFILKDDQNNILQLYIYSLFN